MLYKGESLVKRQQIACFKNSYPRDGGISCVISERVCTRCLTGFEFSIEFMSDFHFKLTYILLIFQLSEKLKHALLISHIGAVQR